MSHLPESTDPVAGWQGQRQCQSPKRRPIPANGMPMSPFAEIHAALAGREGELLATLGIVPPRRGHIRCPLPSHDDRHPSWRWDDRRARWYCTCGGGDVFDLVTAMGWAHDLASAMSFVREVLRLPPIEHRHRETATEHATKRNREIRLKSATQRRLEREDEDIAYAQRRRVKALKMWMCRKPIIGSPAAQYLHGRGISCPLPGTLGILPPKIPGHLPAMIAAFGIPDEPEPGMLLLPPAKLRGVHLTFLGPDGTKAKSRHGSSKITVGVDHNEPIVLAPANDLGGLLIAEGIEEALSWHQDTGLGAWAAGTANRLPGLVEHVPAYVECVAVIVDRDPAGERFGTELMAALTARGVEALPCGA